MTPFAAFRCTTALIVTIVAPLGLLSACDTGPGPDVCTSAQRPGTWVVNDGCSMSLKDLLRGQTNAVAAHDTFGVFAAGHTAPTSYGSGDVDLWLARLDHQGTVLWTTTVVSKPLGADKLGWISAYDVDVNQRGDVTVFGGFRGQATFGSGVVRSGSGKDARTGFFVARFHKDGSALWAKTLGDAATRFVFDMDTDGTGNVYLTGWDGPVTTAPDGKVPTPCGGAFVQKLSGSGTELWTRKTGGDCPCVLPTEVDQVVGGSAVAPLSSIAVNKTGHVAVFGQLYGDHSFGSVTLKSTVPPPSPLAAGAVLAGDGFRRNRAPTSPSQPEDVGQVDYRRTNPAKVPESHRAGRAFVAWLDPDGNFVEAVELQGDVVGTSNSAALDDTGNLTITGVRRQWKQKSTLVLDTSGGTEGWNPLDPKTWKTKPGLVAKMSSALFVYRFDTSHRLVQAITAPTSSNATLPTGVAVGRDGSAYVTGHLSLDLTISATTTLRAPLDGVPGSIGLSKGEFMFVLRVDPSGYITSLLPPPSNGVGESHGESIAVTSSSVVVVGTGAASSIAGMSVAPGRGKTFIGRLPLSIPPWSN